MKDKVKRLCWLDDFDKLVKRLRGKARPELTRRERKRITSGTNLKPKGLRK